jgi:RNA polymerase sigma-70 factor (ECF subfamily)
VGAACGVYWLMDLDAAAGPAALSTMSRTSDSEVAEPAFEDLYESHYLDVYRYAMALTRDRDEALDVTADTFAKAWQRWSLQDLPEVPLAWLLVVARNMATSRLRRARRRLWSLTRRGGSELEEAEAAMWLTALASVLTSRQCEVIALRYQRDLADAEIAKIMRLSESGVRSLAARALDRLREHPEAWR